MVVGEMVSQEVSRAEQHRAAVEAAERRRKALQRIDTEAPCRPQCVAHSLFGFTSVDKYVCRKCGEESEPELANAFVLRAYASELH